MQLRDGSHDYAMQAFGIAVAQQTDNVFKAVRKLAKQGAALQNKDTRIARP
ncbi:MAG: hypothetical protein R3D83_05735 [Caenibius sp.]